MKKKQPVKICEEPWHFQNFLHSVDLKSIANFKAERESNLTLGVLVQCHGPHKRQAGKKYYVVAYSDMFQNKRNSASD